MKQTLREHWLEVRKAIPLARKEEANALIFFALLPYLKSYSYVLSYANIREELSTQIINEKLAEEGRLVLPKIVGNSLWVYRVKNLEQDLEPQIYGIPEPIPEKCEKIDPKLLSHILVPGIAFDSKKHRLGYGKGFFDRFLQLYTDSVTTIGIGYKECYSEIPFPNQKNDISLNQIILV